MDLLLRKLFASLGIPWESNHEFDLSYSDDSVSDKTSEHDPPAPPTVSIACGVQRRLCSISFAWQLWCEAIQTIMC